MNPAVGSREIARLVPRVVFLLLPSFLDISLATIGCH